MSLLEAVPVAGRIRLPRRAPPPLLRRLLGWLAVLGPGLITGAAGDDAGGIATYATVGAQYGYSLLWALGLIAGLLVVVQLQVARLGVVTGKGLAELIRERFGVRWTALAMLALVVANGSVTVAEFAGIGAAAELFGVSRLVAVPVAALMVWGVVVRGSYHVTEKVFLLLALGLLTYVGAAVLARPDWLAVGRAVVAPSLVADGAFVATLVTLVGTTITPYMLFYLQASISDKGVSREEYASERADVVVGSVLSVVVALFIIVATGATLFAAGVRVDTAEDAARALEPLAGPYARILFGVGLFGASMLATGVLPLSTAYAVCGAFGWERGVSRSWAEAPVFNGLYTGLMAVAALFVLLPGLPLIQVILATQTLNGLLLPVVLVFLTRLANDRAILGRYANGPLFRWLAWGTAAGLGALTVLLIGATLLGPLLTSCQLSVVSC